MDPVRAVTPQGVLHTGTSLAGGCSDAGDKQVTAPLTMELLVLCWSMHQFLHGRHERGVMDVSWV